MTLAPRGSQQARANSGGVDDSRSPLGAPRDSRRRSRLDSERSANFWLIVPALVLTLLFIVYPIVETVRLSFVQWGGLGPSTFVGWDNFVALLADDDFLTAIRNNLLFAVIVTIGTVGLGTVFALSLIHI